MNTTMKRMPIIKNPLKSIGFLIIQIIEPLVLHVVSGYITVLAIY